MHDRSLQFLRDLLMTPSPSGYEQSIQDVVRTWATPFADEVRTDRPGDHGTFALGVHELRSGLVAAPGMDDKVGVWTVFEALRLLQGVALNVNVYAVSTVQEELGLRGATTSTYGIHPTIGIAVDVTH